jgi:RNA polymerase sigma-70 factor (ECF subfamily)
VIQAVVEWAVENDVQKIPQSRLDEEDLIRRCQEGDLMAYRSLYERYEQPFLRTALRLLGRRQDAEDAVQEAFLKFYKKVDHYRGGSNFSTYFFRILINCCYDILRLRRPETALDDVSSGLGRDSAPELRYSLDRAIAALPKQMRACFVLFAVEDLRQEEIAQILEISVGAVKAHVHRAKARLRARLSLSSEEVET